MNYALSWRLSLSERIIIIIIIVITVVALVIETLFVGRGDGDVICLCVYCNADDMCLCHGLPFVSSANVALFFVAIKSACFRAVDIWAVGCLLSEMLTGEPLFPGDSDIDQLYHIVKCFGQCSTFDTSFSISV